MSERLTASLEDGTLEKLRTLAGGERKVGAYLSDVVSWLWEYREALQARPLSGMALVHSEWIMTPEEQQQELERRAQESRRMTEIEAKLKEYEPIMQDMRIHYSGLLAQLVELEARLATKQQDSSQNDA